MMKLTGLSLHQQKPKGFQGNNTKFPHGSNLKRQMNTLTPREQKTNFIRHPWMVDGRLPAVSTLSEDTRILTFIAGHAASGNQLALARDWCFLDKNLHAAGLEVIFQTMIYTGIPRTLMALETVCDLGVSGRNVVDSPPGTLPNADPIRQNGEDTMKRIFRAKYARMRSKMYTLHPAMDKWMVEFSYGRIRSRGGLEPSHRELCTLAAMSGNIVFPQFRSGIIGALNSGATLQEVRGILDHTELVWGDESQTMVDALWRDLNKARVVQISASSDNVVEGTSTSNPFRKTLQAIESNKPVDIPTPTGQHPTLQLLQDKTLPEYVQILTLLAAHSVSGNLAGVARDWRFLPKEYHKAGIEVLLQGGLFGGFQRAQNALETVHSVGVDPSALVEEPVVSPREYLVKGSNLLKLIYGKQEPKLREKLRKQHPDIETLIVEFAYGRVLARECEHITPKIRELCALACMSGQMVFPQFHSHLIGSINTGASLEEIRAVLDQTEYVWGERRQAMVDGFWLDFARHR